MTEPTGSDRTERDFLEANERLKARQREFEAQRRKDELKKLGESIPKMSDSELAEKEVQMRAHWERLEREEKEREERDRERRGMEKWLGSGVSERHRQFADANPGGPPGDSAAAYREMCDAVNNGETVVLLGKRGTGKTAMAACLLREWAYRGVDVCFVEAADLFSEFRETFRDESEVSELDLLDGYVCMVCLVIDEAQERGHTEYEDRMLTRLVNKRYGAMRGTVIITNESREAASVSLGASVVSRIREAGKVIECEWDSFRGRK